MRVFVSYTKYNDDLKPDLGQSTQAIKDKLSLLGEVFIDYPLHEPKHVWGELDMCDVFFLIKSENNNKSKWISEEKERAIAKHKNIIEISYGDLLIIKIEELKSMIQINKQ